MLNLDQPVSDRSSHRFTLWLAAGLLLATQVAFSCQPVEPRITITSPTPGAEISGCTLAVEVELSGDIDPSTLQATLNFQPITLSALPPYQASVDASFEALLFQGDSLGDNLLLVKGTRISDGVTMTVGSSFSFAGEVRAFEITNPADLMTGPLAHGRVGDYMLANCVARFVIQDVGQRDMYSVGAFGGNLIDAELVGHPGRESFLELQPMLNVETVVNAQEIEIVNDGVDGAPAVVRTRGPDDLLDFTNPSTSAGSVVGFPPLADDTDLEIEGVTEYSLDPGDRFLRIETTVYNNDATQDLELFVGDWINGGGELEQWTKPGAGLGEGLFDPLEVLSFVGFGEAKGVDYAVAVEPLPEFPDQPGNYFSDSGVTVILHNLSIVDVILGGIQSFPFVVPAGGTKSFTRFFAVGDGAGQNAAAFENELRGTATGTVSGCVTVGGAPALDARVSAGLVDGDGRIDALTTFFQMDAAGCFRGTMSAGNFGAAAAQNGAPYEGGGTEPLVHTFDVTEGTHTDLGTLALPETGRVHVTIVDGNDAPMPGRVTIVGVDPSPEPITPGTSLFPGFSSGALGLFFDPTDALPHGVVAFAYADAAGDAAFDLEPGSYQLFVSRGLEYSAFETPLDVVAGATNEIAAQIVRVIETPGFISSDFHVHGVRSHDSRVSDSNRALQFAGEGIENVVMTDHHVHTDLTPTIAALGLTSFLGSTIGEEITSADYGHFNAYPMTIDPTRTSGGSTDWGQAAPPGMDFPVYGAFGATPSEIDALASLGPQATPETVVQVNHIDSHFEPLKIDTTLVPPRSLLTHGEAAAFRLPSDAGDPEALGQDFFHLFDALEVWNGANVSAQEDFLFERLGIWFNHLNQGLAITAISDTDTHTFLSLRSAGARTFTASPTDAAALASGADVAASVAAGRAVGGQGVYVQTRLLAADGSSGIADLTWSGSTGVTSTNGSVDLEIDVQAPLWAEYFVILIYANATTTGTDENGTPSDYLYGASAARILLRDRDFTIDDVDVDPDVPGARRRETLHVERFDGLAEDTWFAVTVQGFANVSKPIFPISASDIDREANATLAQLLDGNLGEGVLALGFTNALYADVDGEPGFQAPLAP